MRFFDLFFVAQAWAASSAGELHEPSIHEIWFPLVNFSIFALLIYLYAVPLVRDYLRSRRAEVLAAIEESSAKKRHAEEVVQDYRARLANVDEEAGKIQATLRQDGEKEKSKLLSEGQALAVKIKEDARFLAQQEVRMARLRLRQEMADRAQATARELAQRHLAAPDQSRLVEEFIRDIGQVR